MTCIIIYLNFRSKIVLSLLLESKSPHIIDVFQNVSIDNHKVSCDTPTITRLSQQSTRKKKDKSSYIAREGACEVSDVSCVNITTNIFTTKTEECVSQDQKLRNTAVAASIQTVQEEGIVHCTPRNLMNLGENNCSQQVCIIRLNI